MNERMKTYFGTLPLLNIIRRGSSQHVLPIRYHHHTHLLRMEDGTTHTFLMMCQNRRCRACCQIPRSNSRISRACHYLRLSCLGSNAINRITMTSQHHYLGLGANVPYTTYTISTSREEKIESGVSGHTVHTAKMAMIIADNLVILQVPAFHCFVFSAREEIRRTRGD